MLWHPLHSSQSNFPALVFSVHTYKSEMGQWIWTLMVPVCCHCWFGHINFFSELSICIKRPWWIFFCVCAGSKDFVFFLRVCMRHSDVSFVRQCIVCAGVIYSRMWHKTCTVCSSIHMRLLSTIQKICTHRRQTQYLNREKACDLFHYLLSAVMVLSPIQTFPAPGH